MQGRWFSSQRPFLFRNMKRAGFDKIIWIGLVGVMGWVVFRFMSLDRAPLPVLGRISDFNLTNQFSQVVNRTNLEGRIWVADVIFSRCPTQCHRLSQLMARLQSGIPDNAPVNFVSLTADPAYDTPEVLNRYGERYKANPARWWFLTGTKAELYRFAMQDLKFTVVENSTPNPKLEDLFIHSSFFVIVDGKGQIRAVVQAEKASAEYDVAAIVNRLLRDSTK